MLQIRPDQLAALQDGVADGLVARLVEFLASRPELAGYEDLREKVRLLVGRGRQVGLRTERQLAAYVLAGCILGAAFADDDARLDELLASPKTAPMEITRHLLNRVEQALS